MHLSLSEVLLLLSAVTVCYAVGLVFYRLFFHPLAKFPGPKLAAATYWYDFYHDCVHKGQGIFNIERLHEVYGPVVRINPDELAVKDPDWYDVLYNSGRRDKWPRNHKANASAGSIATTTNREHHRMRRAPLSHFFSKRSVETLEDKIRTKVAQLVDGIEKQYADRQRVLFVANAFTALTLDVISDYCFGQSWRCLSAPDFAPEWQRAMTQLFEPVAVTKQFPWINQIMMRLPKSVLAALAPDMMMFFGAKDAVQKQIERIVLERETSGKNTAPTTTTTPDPDSAPSPTIFHAVLDSSLPPSEKTIPRLTDEGFVMVVAGGETTAKTLTTALYHVLANPSIASALRAELDAAIPDRAALPPSSVLERLPLLAAVVRETLRLGAPVTNRLQLIEPAGALQCHGWLIPPGTPVSMSTVMIHWDPVLFPDPQRFAPERWMGEKGRERARYYMPFARGSRACLGSNLAYAELHLGLAAVLRSFEMELVDVVRERDVDVVRDCFVGMPSTESKGVRVKITKVRE